MGQRKLPKQLAKFISYMLGRRPDEFGLVPDTDVPDPPIEISGNLVRVKSREHLPERIPAPNLPKLFYTCIRRKAYPFVMDKGIFPIGRGHVILSSEKKLAEKMGKRIDQTPVLLTVQTQKSVHNGVIFFQTGDLLFIADTIPVGCFTGPPLPKEKPEPKKEDTPKKEKPKSLPGTFLMDLTDAKDRNKRSKHERKRKEIAWKKERKKMKRKKENMWEI